MKTLLPKRRLCRGDFIAVGCTILLCAISFFFLLSGNDNNDKATVTTADTSFEIDLTHDFEKQVTSNGYNYVIKVESGRAFVKEADCPDGTCRSMKPVTINGGSVICVPGKLVIEASGKGGTADADLIVP